MQKQYPTSHFTPITATDLQLVWQWRNKPHIRRNMHNDGLISRDEHLNWFHQLQQNKLKQFFIFRQNKRPVGVLNFSRINDDTLEWGCYLGEDDVWPGSGLLLEIAALDYAASLTPVQQLYAEILSFNQAVLKMHTLFGYQPLPPLLQAGVRDNDHYDVMRFTYSLAEWRARRGAVLSRLPKQITAAAEYIKFDI